ncbi:hypothetical protein BG000_007225 [Podila horticola]|nr:hypothetical protein BG000_007225 [Podila horticola]
MSTPNVEPLSSESTAPESLLPKLEPYKMATPKPRLTEEERANRKKPKVLIVGAGIGGLMLAILLKKGGIPFLIFERAKEVKPLGSALALGANLRPLFEQLGIYEEFKKIGKPGIQLQVFSDALKPQFVMDFTERERLCGAMEYVVSRPDLYNLLLRQIPQENIYMSKKVLSFLQNENGVMIRCADSSTHEGDILIGADGAYSAVRQHLYSELKKEKKLPASDDVPLPYSCVCLVGQTEPLDPEEYPHLKMPFSQFLSIHGEDTSFKWSTLTTIKHTVCWGVVQYLTKETKKENDSFRNSEWGPEAAEVMCKQVRDFKVPGGKDGHVLTIGQLIDKTPKNLISKVMLEEKLNPAGGAGALSAMHDAVALANWICSLESTKLSEIESVFQEYQAERLPIAKQTFATSQMFSKMGGKDFSAMVLRGFIKRMPAWLWRRVLIKMCQARPKASFLPLVEDKGTERPLYQASFEKTLAIVEERNKAKTKNAQGGATA